MVMKVGGHLNKYMFELESLSAEAAASLFQLGQLKELVNSSGVNSSGFANDVIAAELHEVADKLGCLSMTITALAWSINAVRPAPG
jgi:hypothetical protein